MSTWTKKHPDLAGPMAGSVAAAKVITATALRQVVASLSAARVVVGRSLQSSLCRARGRGTAALLARRGEPLRILTVSLVGGCICATCRTVSCITVNDMRQPFLTWMPDSGLQRTRPPWLVCGLRLSAILVARLRATCCGQHCAQGTPWRRVLSIFVRRVLPAARRAGCRWASAAITGSRCAGERAG